MTISRKVFLVFAVLFAATAVLGGTVVWIVGGMQRSANRVEVIQRFQMEMQRLGVIGRGEGGGDVAAKRGEFDRRWTEARTAAGGLRGVYPDLPPDLRGRLDKVDEQLEFFRDVTAELLDRRETDESLHLENHALVEALATEILTLPVTQRLARATTMARLETAWARAYHERSPAAVAELHTLLEEARGSWDDGEAVARLGRFVTNSERGYLNHLGTREREAMQVATAARLDQVAGEAIAAVRAATRRGHSRLTRGVGWAVAASLGLTLLLWLGCTRYLRRFLETSRQTIDQVRAGRYRVSVAGAPADEFGDLTRFLGEVAAELGDTVGRLRESQDRYQGLVEELADWVWETDATGCFTYCSPTGGEMLGLAPELVMEQTLDDVFGGGSPLPVRAEDGHLSRWRRPDGEERVLESRWSLRPEKGGGTRGVTRDVTARVRAEEERAHLQEQLVHAQKMEAVGTLSGGVAHDFNNLLQSIGGYAELVLHTHQDVPGVADALRKILGATHRAARLTEQLLVFGRRDRGRPQPVDLNGELEQVVEMLRRTIPKMIEIHLELAPELPPALVDPLQLEQVVVNLALNARDAMPRGGDLLVRTETLQVLYGAVPPHPELAPGDYVTVEMRDSGEGMTAEVQSRVFEPFFTTKEVGKGTGLGLAMVYGIAEGHGGAVVCRSAPGQGSSFTVFLPVASTVAAMPAGLEEAGGEARLDPLPAGTGGGTVLVVDDEPWVRELGVEILTGGGYTVLEADSGEGALDRYRERGGALDLVVLDLNMPGMGGEECFRRLLEADPGLRVLIATGHLAGPGDGGGGLSRAVGWIRKPYRVQDLLVAVNRALAA